MKCQVLYINRLRAKHYKNAMYNANAGIIKKGFLKGTEGFYIPDKCIPIELEIGNKTIPLFHVNELTGSALTCEFIPEPRPEAETATETEKIIKPKETPQESQLVESTYSRPEKKKEYDKHKDAGRLLICEKSDPETKLKLNVLVKQAFWEMLAKQLKLSLLSTIIYLCAGGGIFIFGLYIIKVIFLKEATI
jgi:hypothetical protein